MTRAQIAKIRRVRCNSCGYEFEKIRLRKDSKCPKCKSFNLEHIKGTNAIPMMPKDESAPTVLIEKVEPVEENVFDVVEEVPEIDTELIVNDSDIEPNELEVTVEPVVSPYRPVSQYLAIPTKENTDRKKRQSYKGARLMAKTGSEVINLVFSRINAPELTEEERDLLEKNAASALEHYFPAIEGKLNPGVALVTCVAMITIPRIPEILTAYKKTKTKREEKKKLTIVKTENKEAVTDSLNNREELRKAYINSGVPQ